MASLLSPRQSRSPISLRATEPTEDRPDLGSTGGGRATWSWLLTAAAGAAVVALAGWVLVAGMTVVGWVTSEPGTLGAALEVGTNLWLVGNGGGSHLAGLGVTLVPLGYVAILAFLISRCAGYAVRQLPADHQGRGSSVLIGTVLKAAGVMVAAYVVPLMATALLLGHPMAALRAGAVMTPVVALAAAFGACRALGYRVTDHCPVWSRAIPRAVAAALLVLLVVGVLAVVIASLQHLGRIERLVQTLDAGLAGNLALLAVQLAYAPNVAIWAAGYTLGGAFSLGAGSVVAMTGTELGALPAVPLFGAVSEGALPQSTQLWWLAGGVLAGVVAALVIALARPQACLLETTLVGGAAGVLAGGVFTGLSWCSGGALGAGRLADVGPTLWPLIVLATATVGLAGLAAGLLLGSVRMIRRAVERRRSARA